MKYDLVVIGAGIQGAGVAQAAAAAGYSVLVLEQTAPAAGTSSKSSNLYTVVYVIWKARSSV